MKKTIIIGITLFLAKNLLHSQLWMSVGGGCSGEVRDLLPDSVSGLLYAVGSFHNAGGTEVWGVATWNGINWNPVGGGTGDTLNESGGPPILSVARFGADIFVGGMMGFMEGDRGIRFLSRWDGTRWNACGNPTSQINLEVTNGQLFAMGYFDSISGHPIELLASWDGQKWVRFGDSLHFGFSDNIWSSEFYKGEYYFAGNFNLPGGFNQIIRWDGSQWKAVGDSSVGGAAMNDITVYKGQLFVGGQFSAGNGNPSSNLMAWDGNQWYDPFPNIQYTTQVHKLEVIDGELYIVGNHAVWDGSQWQGLYNLAKYDGQNFCSFGGKYIWTLSIASYQNELYVSTGEVINPFGADSLFPNGRDTVNFIAKWIGGDSVDVCISQPVKVDDAVFNGVEVKLFPNPTHTSFTITFPPTAGSCTIRIRDITGRQVGLALTYHAGDPPVDVEGLPSGLYFVEVTLRGKSVVTKLVLE